MISQGEKGISKVQKRRSNFLDTVCRYARGPLANRLGWEDRNIQVVPAVHGARSLVYFLDIEELSRFVLRAVPGFSDAWKLSNNLSRLKSFGLSVPKLILKEQSPIIRRKWGFYPIIEEYISGNHVSALGRNEPSVRSIATTLAQFHQIERTSWGLPAIPIPRWGSYRRYYMKRIARRAYTLDKMIEVPRSKELIKWYMRCATSAPLDPPYSLLHARVNDGNFVVSSEGKAYAVDLLECRYGTFAADVNWALERICMGDSDRIQWFMNAYSSEWPGYPRKEFEASRQFFSASYWLNRAAIQVRRIQRQIDKGEPFDDTLASLRRHVSLLSQITEIHMKVV